MSINPVQHDRMKHMEMMYHYVQDMVQRCVVELWYIPTDEQIMDVLTKLLGPGKFMYFQDRLRVMEDVSLAEREC
jgi:hypothetical protein